MKNWMALFQFTRENARNLPIVGPRSDRKLVIFSSPVYIVIESSRPQGHPTDRFGKLSVRKALNHPMIFYKGNFHLER